MKVRATRRREAVRLPLPAIAVGNLSVGGTGKTPLAAWIAEYCAARGRTAAILLRGYGGDEPLVHRRLAPRAVVVANPDRVAAAGIADPLSFGAQLRAAGAIVQLVAYQDHHPYAPADVERLARAARGGDYVVVTEKDAVKLRARWPGAVPEPLVAVLAVRWERNGRVLEQAVDSVLGPAAAPET